jgi:hypothetical protein
MTLITVVATCAPTAASAQGVASSFAELRLLVRAGDEITVLDNSGAESAGRILSLSPSSIGLLVDGSRQDLEEARVAAVFKRMHDPLRNGALVGFGTAAGLFALTIASVGCEGCESWVLASGFVYASLGAAVGVGIDALIARPKIVYEKAPSASRLRVSPIFGGRRRGVALQLNF